MKIDKFFLFILTCIISFQAFSDEHSSDSGDVDINALIDTLKGVIIKCDFPYSNIYSEPINILK